MSKIIDGKLVADQKAKSLEKKVKKLKQSGVIPGLAVILVGDNQASQVYVRNKKKRAESLGINFELIELPENTTNEIILSEINRLNLDDDIDGILVQLPLPKQIDEELIINAIDPKKDVDGFSPVNFGKLWQNDAQILPATAAGIMSLLDYYKIDIAGKDVLIINRSNIVGRPLAALMLNNDATVTIAHSKTTEITAKIKKADIVISAVGQAGFLKSGMLKPSATLIDVGMNRDENNKLVGDADFNDLIDEVEYLTPVPGGVGPMTIISLMEQVIQIAAKRVKVG